MVLLYYAKLRDFLLHHSGNVLYIPKLVFSFIEPVGTRAPKLTQADSKFKVAERDSGFDIPILCQAQGFPVPSFRYIIIPK